MKLIIFTKLNNIVGYEVNNVKYFHFDNKLKILYIEYNKDLHDTFKKVLSFVGVKGGAQ